MSNLFISDTDARERSQTLAMTPTDYDALAPKWYEGIPTGVAQGINRGLASTFALGNRILPYTPVGIANSLVDKALGQDTTATNRELAQDWLEASRLDPATHGTAANILYGFGSYAPAIAAGAFLTPLAGAAVAGGTTFEGASHDLQAEGVDPGTANIAAGVEGLLAGVGAYLPMHVGGSTLRNVLGVGPAVGIAQDLASRYSTAEVLEANGYGDLAAQYRHLDAANLMADVVIGSAFGWLGARGERIAKEKIDAALAVKQARAKLQSILGVAVDAESQAKNAAAFDKALADLASDKAVDVTGVDGATFLRDPQNALERLLEQNGYHEELAQLKTLQAELEARGIQGEDGAELPAIPRSPAFDLNDERTITNPIPFDATPAEKLAAIAKLTEENKPIVDQFLADLDAELGTQSKSNVKSEDAILGKASRPSILAEKPWHGIEHIRDTFRFKTVVNSIADLPKIAAKIAGKGWKIVKVDTAKMLTPKEWGWRFVALDLQMPNGQLVEFYMPLREMEDAKGANHLLFEKWRNRDMTTLTPEERRERRADIELSYETYEAAFLAALKRTGENETDLRAALESFRASAGEGLSNESSSTPTVIGKGALSDQAPETLNALNPSGPKTATVEPESETYTSSTVGMGDSSEPIIPKSGVLADGGVGNATHVVTERGTRIEARWAVVDAADLVTSHDNNLAVNPDFPAELQPRDRSRAASEQQITKIANAINPELLVESPKAADGAPIVGKDGVVESGNARTIALRRAYANGKAEAYRQYLIDNAARFGLDPAKLEGVKQPVLVRVTEGGYDRAEFTRQANEATVASMSSTEQARADAARMPDMTHLITNDNGQINSVASSQFIASFMKHVVGDADLGKMMQSDGTLSQDGQARIRNAVFAKAYGDSNLVALMTEATDANVKNVLTAMLRAAAPIAKLREMMAEGARDASVDITPDFIAAVRKFSQLRADGQTVDQYLSQADMFGDPSITPKAKDLLVVLGENSKAPKRMAEFLTRWVDMVDSLGDPRQGDVFGAKPSGDSLVSKARADTERANAEPSKTGDMFGFSARRLIAENPAAKVATEAGDATVLDVMTDADNSVDSAANDSKQFDAAVSCSLRFGT